MRYQIEVAAGLRVPGSQGVRGSNPLSSTKPSLCEPIPTRSSSGFFVVPPAVTPASVGPGRPRVPRGGGGVSPGVLSVGRCPGAVGVFWASRVTFCQLGVGLIEFGRHAARRRAARGAGKPETFDFLGFTHLCGKTKNGRFWLRRITISKRMRAKLREVKDQLKRNRHRPIPVQGHWLRAVVQGHLAYYAVPGNTDAVAAFRTQATRHWYKALRRRSQRTRLTWERMNRIAKRWLPPARVKHPFPNVRFDARTRGRSPVR